MALQTILPVTQEVGSHETLGKCPAALGAAPAEQLQVVQDVRQSVRVSTNQVVEREAEFVSDALPVQQTITQTAHLPANHTTAVTSQVRPELSTDDLKPSADWAVETCRIVAPSTMLPLTLTETSTQETVGSIVQPASAAPARAALEMPEQRSVVISEQLVVEREEAGNQFVAPKGQQVTVELATKEAVTTAQQVQIQHSTDYTAERPTEMSLPAKIVPSVMEGKAAQVTEVLAGSVASQLTTATALAETAQVSMPSMEIATSSQVSDFTREADWAPGAPHPASKKAQTIPAAEVRSVQVETTQTVESEGEFQAPKMTRVEPNSSVTAAVLETSTLYSADVLQKETPLADFTPGQFQSARPAEPAEQRTVQVFTFIFFVCLLILIHFQNHS